jgi:chemotaxis protein MotA
MTFVFGIIMVFGLVFGGFVLSGGKFDIILHALPLEGMMIGGASIGAFIISNGIPIIKGAGKGFIKVLKGPKWKKDDYNQILALLFEITRLHKMNDAVKLDGHMEDPHNSKIFQRYPRIMADHHLVDLITDTYRMVNLGQVDPMQVENELDRKLSKHHHEVMAPADAIQAMADGLPAIGIVAAVLGVIKTMSSIDQPPVILGGMIGGALVGTFLGVFLAYCMVMPVASRLKQIEEEDASMYNVVRATILASLSDNAPQVSVESGRGAIPSRLQPSFYEVEEAQKSIPVDV